MGPTRVWYLLGAGAAAPGGWETGAAEEEPTAVLPCVAVRAEAGGAVATAARLGLELPAGGGEERHTLGLKLCPPRVFTMVGQENERRWRGGLQTRKGDLKLKR